MLPPGTRIGSYEIVSPLGVGGMGEVYRAHDGRLARDVALKLLPGDAAHDQGALDRFVREARAASSLSHPNIVTIHEIGEATQGRFVVMELVHGRTLRSLVAERPPIEEIVRLAAQTANALSVAHAAGIVHRDVKPENIMVRSDGYVKLVDFGLAGILPQSMGAAQAVTAFQTATGVLLGTVRYMSPEQANGAALDGATDVFSLGLVVYELATGHHPFIGDSNFAILGAIISQPALLPSRLNPEISPALDGLIMSMLHKEPRLRPTAADLAATLPALLQSNRPAPDATAVLTRITRKVVGREHQLEQLAAAFDAAANGRGQMLCISGEPGIGKSTLIDSFLDGLATSAGGVLVARGRCSARLAAAQAYVPLIEILDSLIHTPSGDHVARQMKLLAPSWYAQVAPQHPSGGATAGATTVSPQRLSRELTQFLEELCRTRPLVLMLDDVHWIDLSSTDMLADLAGRFEAMRLLIIVSYRPTELLTSHHPFASVKLDLQARGAAQELVLDGLEAGAIERLLAQAFPAHQFPATFAELIHAKTEGNPLFVSELLRYLRDKRIIVEESSIWRLIGSLPDVARELPESVRGVIQQQIDRLSDAERRVLIGASVQGPEFHAAVVAGAIGADPVDVEELLDGLDRVHKLVRRVREEELPDHTLTLRYRFTHVLYQNALYSSLTPAKKAALSAAVAKTLLAFYGDVGSASEVALLFEAARDFSNAADYFLRAARQAARVAAHHEAVLLARRGLRMLTSLPESPERDSRELALLLTLGVPLTAQKSYASTEVGDTYARAKALALQTASPQVFPVLHGLYRFYFVRADLDTSLDLSRELLERAEQAGDPARLMEAHRAMGNSLFYRGGGVEGRRHLEKAIALYDETRDRSHAVVYGVDPSVASLTVTALALWNEGYADQAKVGMRNALARARASKHPFTLAWALAYAANLGQNCGDRPATRHAAGEGLQLATEHEFPFWAAAATIMGARAAFDEGADASDALGRMRRGIDAWFEIGAQNSAPYFLT